MHKSAFGEKQEDSLDDIEKNKIYIIKIFSNISIQLEAKIRRSKKRNLKSNNKQ